MHIPQPLKKDLLRVTRNALLALFLIPGLSFLFILYVQSSWDREFVTAVVGRVQAEADANPAVQGKHAVVALVQATPPSAACSATDPALASYRAEVCEPFKGMWQFHWAGQVAKLTLLLGLALCIAVPLLARMAFQGRNAQYRSLVLSWRLLAWSSALLVVVQSALLVWLSFWVTAYFFEIYVIKLIAMIGLVGGAAAIAAVVQIFARIPIEWEIDGELVGEADAPALWTRIRALAAKMNTAPPDQIVAGIDANFFVTEGAVVVQGRALKGRTLYVSLPLLRVLDQLEADAVLAHELAHFKGGDTRSGAALGPKLAQFDTYCARMSGPSLTLIAFFLLAAYRTVFELALMRDSRKREFMADRAAAKCVHRLPLVRSLVKVAAYCSYRDHIERALFEREQRHEGAIGIAAYVAQGLLPFARSPQFQDLMQDASTPHPFDSHPGLVERMENVGCMIAEHEFGQVLAHPVLQSWSTEILNGEAIEARLWAAYESGFAQSHEQDLAYRYLPQTDAERDIVVKHFPPRVFPLDKGKRLAVHHHEIHLPDATVIAFGEIKDIEYEDGLGGDVLKIQLLRKGIIGHKSKTVRLPGARRHRELLKDVLGRYWHRHKVAHGIDT